MGEPFDRLAIFGRFHAGHSHQLREQGGRHSLRREAGLRILCSGTQLSQVCSQGVRQQLPVLCQEAQAHQDEIDGSDSLARM